MANLFNEVSRHLNDDVIMQLAKQLGAADANQVKKAAGGAAEILLDAVSKSANHQERGGGLFGAIEKDHDGGILGDLLGTLTGRNTVNNPSTMNGEGIINHLLGKKQLEMAQVVSQFSGLNLFKSGVLMQLIAPVIMGVVGQKQRSGGLDLGGLANVLLGGSKEQAGKSGSLLGKVLDMDGDGSMMDDLLGLGMKMLRN